MKGNPLLAKVLYMLEKGESIVDIAIELGERNINSMGLSKSNIHIMASKGKGNAFDLNNGVSHRVFSLAYDKYVHPTHYVFIGSEQGWSVTTEDTQIKAIYESFLNDLFELVEHPIYKKSFETTGITKNNVTWSGRKLMTLEGADFSAM